MMSGISLKILALLALVLACSPAVCGGTVNAQTSLPGLQLDLSDLEQPEQVSVLLQIVLLLTVLTLAPAILILFTSFTRIIVVFSFLRQAMGTQQMPPNQVMIGLALFLTFYVMSPVFDEMNRNALQPYLQEEINRSEALDRAQQPLRKFMLSHTREKDLALFLSMAQKERPKNVSEVPTLLIVPAFALSEIRTAFQIGFLVYVPFLVLDMVIASVLLSMGMMMLPPVMISLPFKLLLFVLVDGWNLLVGSLIRSFY